MNVLCLIRLLFSFVLFFIFYFFRSFVVILVSRTEPIWIAHFFSLLFNYIPVAIWKWIIRKYDTQEHSNIKQTTNTIQTHSIFELIVDLLRAPCRPKTFRFFFLRTSLCLITNGIPMHFCAIQTRKKKQQKFGSSLRNFRFFFKMKMHSCRTRFPYAQHFTHTHTNTKWNRSTFNGFNEIERWKKKTRAIYEWKGFWNFVKS